jgi:hypothetical protein
MIEFAQGQTAPPPAEAPPGRRPRSGTLRNFSIVAANALAGFGAMIAVSLSVNSPFVAVIAAPWSVPEQMAAIVASADGALVAPARFGWIVIAHSPRADFVSRLKQAGAWLVLDHRNISGCFPGL